MLPSLHLNKPSPVLSFPAQWRPPFSRFPCTPVWGQIQPPRQCPSCYLPATDPTLTAVLTQIAFWVLMETKWCLALLTHPISFWACNYLTLKLCCKREVAASKSSLPKELTPTYPAAEPVALAQHQRWMIRDEAGHTHSIRRHLAGPCLRADGKVWGHSIPQIPFLRAVPHLNLDKLVFSNELKPSSSPRTYIPVFFKSQRE